jgi:hypothetical protein
MSPDGSISHLPFCNKYFPGFAEDLNSHAYSINNSSWLRPIEKSYLLGLKTKDTSVFVFLSAGYGSWNHVVINDLQKVKPSVEVVYFNLDVEVPQLDSNQRALVYAAQMGTREFLPN